MKPFPAWHLPWRNGYVPHALLDIIRGCNITCEACYNARPPSVKPLAEIEAELNALQRLRRLSSVSIIGGEVLLHSQLPDVIRLLTRRGLGSEIFTNGVLLTDELAATLKEAGLNVAFLHIESGQQRPDLPARPTLEQLRDCWQAKAALLVRHGIDAALSVTAYADRLDEMDAIVRFTIESEHVHYLLVTLYRDMSDVACIRGGLADGMTAELHPGAPPRMPRDLTNLRIFERLESQMGLRPFAYLGSNADRDDPRWLSYLVATSRGRDGQRVAHCVRASAFEKAFVHASRLIVGRFPMYRAQKSSQLAGQLAFNALTGGHGLGNVAFLHAARRGGGPLLAKRLLFQNPAEVDASGRVIHCAHCPDAVLQGGRLVPVCLTDQVDAAP